MSDEQWGSTMTVDRRRSPGENLRPGDVHRARAGVRHAGVTYGMPDRRVRTRVADRLHEFVARYGWRAYALPVLIVVTVAALMTTHEVARRQAAGGTQHSAGTAGDQSAPPVAGDQIPLKNDNPGDHVDNTVLKAAALPSGTPYAKHGDGTFKVLNGSSPVVGAGRLYRYSIEVEHGVDQVDLAKFQQTVTQALADKRSWSGHGVALKRVDSGPIDFRVSLTSSMTVRSLCGYTVHVETSCFIDGRVVLNDSRWARGSAAYIGDVTSYRQYMVNHEVGHALGHQHAHQCLPGGLAPAMMQQTFGLRSAATGAMCQANPWPYPSGAKGAPGAEQPDTPQNDEYNLGD